MKIKSLLRAVALATTLASPAAAVPINLGFSFGGVSGIFYGLDNADGFSTASSYDFFGAAGDYTSVQTAGADSNLFTFNRGVLEAVDFSQFPNVTGVSTRNFLGYLAVSSGDSQAQEWIYSVSFPVQVVTIGTAEFKQHPVAAVPLPAGALLLLTGLAGVAGLKRRKKHTA